MNQSIVNLDKNVTKLHIEYQAPLARQESLTDISHNCDDLYFDDSINFNSNPKQNEPNEDVYQDEEFKRNLAWWPYQETNLNLDSHNLTDNSPINVIQEGNKIKIQINCKGVDSDAESIKNRTSTPRNDSSSKNSDLKLNNNQADSMITNDSNENKESNSFLSSFRSGDCKETTSSNFESSCSFSFNQTKSDTKLEMNNLNNLTNTTNYTSIEKLDIIKPQSRDYILCFDTSSLIDQTSSICTSNEAFNCNLAHVGTISTNSIQNDVFTSKARTSLNENNFKKIESNLGNRFGYDSGVDTARTLSPQIFVSSLGNDNQK